jgi:hypothetical protein
MSAYQVLNGKSQFLDFNGRPLAGGFVHFYIPNTSTPKNTYQDQAGTVLNTNPVRLDAAGRATIWGTGLYRQVVNDTFGNLIWDQVTDSAASASLMAQVPIAVNSIGALRAQSKANYSQVSVLGYYTPGDGGGGLYYLDSSDTTSSDNGGTIIVAADGGRWKLATTGSISVAQFGLKGDGSDETTGLTNVITVTATAGLTLDWPMGKTYSFTNIFCAVAGGAFHWTGTPKLTQLATRNAAANGLELDGIQSATLTLIATALSQSNVITISDGTQVAPGNTIRLLTDRLAYGDHRFDPNNCLGQLVKVASVSGNIVTLEDPLVFDLPVSTITTGTAQGGTSGTITLSASDPSTAAQLNNYLLTITAGTGAGQTRYINTYNPTTKVVDIGTTYTGFPQAPWTTIPDATSQYSVTATCQALVMQTASARLSGLEIQGYPASGVAVRGVQISYCDSPVIENSKISGFSNHALYTYHNYRPKVIGNTFTGANYVTPGGGGLGYGLFTLGNFGQIVSSNTADNCHTGFDSDNGEMYLLREGNTVTGGGLTYDGNQFWPQNANYPNSGISSHTGSFYITDIGNQICDVYNSMQKGFGQTFQGNTIRGRVWFCVEASYCTSVTYIGNTYEDGMTVDPSSGMNGDVNGDDGPQMVSNFSNRAIAFLGIRQATLVPNATIVAKGNRAKSPNQSFAYVTNPTPTGNPWSLTLTENDVSCVTEQPQIMAVLKHDGTAVPSIQNLIVYNNLIRVGGAILGGIKADNINKYPFIDALTPSGPMTIQTGLNQWLCTIPPNTVCPVPVPNGGGQLVYKLTIFEKLFAVTNYFSGIIQVGNSTPILTVGNSGVAFRIDTPSGTTGTAGDLNVWPRASDNLWINNLTPTAGKFVVSVESDFS